MKETSDDYPNKRDADEFKDLKRKVLDILEFSNGKDEIDYAIGQLGLSEEEALRILSEIESDTNPEITLDGSSQNDTNLKRMANLFKASLKDSLPDYIKDQPIPIPKDMKPTRADYNILNLIQKMAVASDDMVDKESIDFVDFREKYEQIRLVASDYFEQKSQMAIIYNPDIYQKMIDATDERFLKLVRVTANHGDIGHAKEKEEMDAINNFLLEDSTAYWMDREHWLGEETVIARTSIENDRTGKIDALVLVKKSNELPDCVLGIDYTTGSYKTLLRKLSQNLEVLYYSEPSQLMEAAIIDDTVVEKGSAFKPLILCMDRKKRDIINEQSWVEFSTGSMPLMKSTDMAKERAPYAYLCLEEIVLQLEYYQKHQIHLEDLGYLLEYFKARRDEVKEMVKKPEGILKNDSSYNDLKNLLHHNPKYIRDKYQKIKDKKDTKANSWEA